MFQYGLEYGGWCEGITITATLIIFIINFKVYFVVISYRVFGLVLITASGV